MSDGLREIVRCQTDGRSANSNDSVGGHMLGGKEPQGSHLDCFGTES